MSYETPILTAGGASNQSVYTTVETARHPVGTSGTLLDGRRYVYSCNRGSAIAAGVLVKMTEPASTDAALAVNTASANDTTLDLTFGGSTTLAVNQLAGGYVNVQDDTGEGQLYRIESHAALAAATALTVTIEPIRVAFAAATSVSVIQHPNNNVAIADAGNYTQKFVGATTAAVGAGSSTPQFFWAQTYGPASVLNTGTGGVGTQMTVSASVAGSVGLTAEGGSGTGTYDPVVATMLDLAGLDGEHAAVFLTL